MLQRRIESHCGRDRLAYLEVATGRSLSYAQLVAHRDRLKSYLATRIQPADVVILCAGNCIEYPIWFLSILAAGANVLPVSPELTISELTAIAQRAGAKAVVGSAATNALLNQSISTIFPLGLALTADGATDRAGRGGDLLLASSGTTGQMKIARRSSASLDAVAKNMADAIGFDQSDQVLACVPLTHSYGLEHGLLAPLWAGSTVHLCSGFDLPQVTRALADVITIWPAVPSMIELLSTVGDSTLQLKSTGTVYSAGGPLPLSVYEQFRLRFGVRVGQLYGMTEIGSVTFGSPHEMHFNPQSVGRPMAGVSIRVLNVDQSAVLCQVGQEGQIAVRARSMFSGYIEGDAALIDGHFLTGDLGHLDEHANLVITGRVRLLIDTGGIKVNPAEVEAVLGSHPQVLECVVVPVRQSETVCRLKAIVVARDLTNPPDPQALRAFARQRLAGYKVPRMFEFQSALPRTDTGKIKRAVLEAS